MFCFLKPTEREDGPRPIAMLEPGELKNVLEQERIIEDVAKALRMLQMAYQVTMRAIAAKYQLPQEFELDRRTGEVFGKGPAKDG